VAHPSWSGQLQISLVSFGVRFFPATGGAGTVSFHEIDRETGERVRHLNVVDNNRPIERSQIIKGYEYRKNKYVTLDPDEIASLRIPSKHSLAIAQFVPIAEIDPAFFERPYFVVPADDQQMQAYSVVREALRESGKAGIGEVSFDRREHLVAIMPQRDKKAPGLMAYTLRYVEELRNAEEYFPPMKVQAVDADQLDLAKELIQRHTRKFRPEDFVDDYETALRELVEAKVKHTPLPREEREAKPEKVVNLMDALRRSIGQKNAKPAKKPPARSQKKGPVLVKRRTQSRRAS
jgi:DNA end-binding protein Ku